MSPIDFRVQKLNRHEARKLIAKIMTNSPECVRFSSHALRELANDSLTTTDALNVLKSPDSKIHQEGEFANGSYRYRLETSILLIVVAFAVDGSGLNVVDCMGQTKG
jgi:hypothetical protein